MRLGIVEWQVQFGCLLKVYFKILKVILKSFQTLYFYILKNMPLECCFVIKMVIYTHTHTYIHTHTHKYIMHTIQTTHTHTHKISSLPLLPRGRQMRQLEHGKVHWVAQFHQKRHKASTRCPIICLPVEVFSSLYF